MSARLTFVEGGAHLAEKQAAEIDAKDEAKDETKDKPTVLKELGIREPKPDMSVSATEAGSSRIVSQKVGQDRLTAPTRNAGTTMGTLVRPELDYTPQTMQERERVEAWLRDRTGSASLEDEDSAPPWFHRRQLSSKEDLP